MFNLSYRSGHESAGTPAPVAATGLVGKHVAMGVVASLVPTLVFAFIWRKVKDKGKVTTEFDRDVSDWMHAHQKPGLTEAAGVLADIGSGPTVVAIAGAAMAVGIVSHRHRGAAWTLPIAVVGAGALIEASKLIFRRKRPTYFKHLVKATGYSFPSGHSFISVTVYGLIGYFAMTDVHRRGARVAIATSTGCLIALIGLSRVYVGVHYPTDVLAGWTGGVPWLYTCIKLHENLVRRFDGAGTPVLESAPE
jgi:undecaprenyl-diphosphatase